MKVVVKYPGSKIWFIPDKNITMEVSTCISIMKTR